MIKKEFKGKAIILSAPSGAGKTTIVKRLLESSMPLCFSVSACSRPKRNKEENGVDYHFLDTSAFKQKIKENAFIEWEEVYENNYYGTLKSEINRIWELNNHVIFDVDVIGGISLKNYFKETALSIFINPPSLEVLFKRLTNRNTEDRKSLQKRMDKAENELSYKNHFDKIITNDKLDFAVKETKEIIEKFILKS
jgi:guanylate kinase